jgi:hypothetical protein
MRHTARLNAAALCNGQVEKSARDSGVVDWLRRRIGNSDPTRPCSDLASLADTIIFTKVAYDDTA